MVRKLEIDIKDDKFNSVGEILKANREAQKLSIKDVADKIRIRADYIDAIENSDFSRLPGAVYASGFVRSYAKFLGLDAGAIYDRFKDETSGNDTKVILTAREPEQEGGIPHKKELFIALIAILVIYLFWALFMGQKDKSDVMEEVNESAKTSVFQESSSSSEQKTVLEEVSTKKIDVEEVAEKRQEDTNAAFTQKQDDERLKKEKPLDLTRSYGAKDGQSRVVLVANSEVWVQVEQDGKILLSRVLAKGDRYNVPDEEYDLTLRAGNATGLDIFVDGNKVKPLGRRGTIVRNVPIDAFSLLDRN